MAQEVRCGQCGTTIPDETPLMSPEERKPCPNCGATYRRIPAAPFSDTAPLSPDEKRRRRIQFLAVMLSVGFSGGILWLVGNTWNFPNLKVVGYILGGCFMFLLMALLKALEERQQRTQSDEYRARLIQDLAQERHPTRDHRDVQPAPEPDFFARLVGINFTYIETYYRQTQVQANRSFTLSAIAAIVSLGVTVGGIVMMFKESTTRAAVVTAVGAFSELVSAVFFYLYNRTVLKMGEYHQKLVMTQNVALALKIAEGLPDDKRADAQIELVKSLSKDINKYLSAPVNSVQKQRDRKAKAED